MEDYLDDMDDYWFCDWTTRKSKLIANDPTKHYPNKDEARELRKIMSSTGLTEEQVRANPTHRKALSEAQKAGQKAKRNKVQKYYQCLIKKACKISKQAQRHPETIKVLDELLKADYYPKQTAATVVKYYTK